MDNYDFNRLEAKLDRLIALKEWEMSRTYDGRSALQASVDYGKIELKKTPKKQLAKKETSGTIVDVVIIIIFIGLCSLPFIL